MPPQVLQHFRKTDPVIYSILKKHPQSLPEPISPSKYFSKLASTIVGQQLSGKAADTIWGRFVLLLPKKQVSPQPVLKLEISAMRQAGLSSSKASYLHHLSNSILTETLILTNLSNLPDDKVIETLTRVKGIGPWSAEMFLIFSLGRPDVFSSGDQGLKNAIKKLYSQSPDTNLWSPYRSYACLALWHSLDNR